MAIDRRKIDKCGDMVSLCDILNAFIEDDSRVPALALIRVLGMMPQQQPNGHPVQIPLAAHGVCEVPQVRFGHIGFLAHKHCKCRRPCLDLHTDGCAEGNDSP